MSENNRNLNKEYQPSSSENSSDIAAQLQKIQTHLGFLEKKLDLILAQQGQGGGGHRPSGGPPRGDFRPRRPFRPGGGDFRKREHHSDRGEGRPMREGNRDDRPREFRGGSGGDRGRGPSGGGHSPFKKRPRHF